MTKGPEEIDELRAKAKAIGAEYHGVVARGITVERVEVSLPEGVTLTPEVKKLLTDWIAATYWGGSFDGLIRAKDGRNYYRITGYTD